MRRVQCRYDVQESPGAYDGEFRTGRVELEEVGHGDDAREPVRHVADLEGVLPRKLCNDLLPRQRSILLGEYVRKGLRPTWLRRNGRPQLVVDVLGLDGVGVLHLSAEDT